MATYPNLPIHLRSLPQPEPTVVNDVSYTGILHTLTTRSTQYYRIRITHRYITTKQYRNLLDTYLADQDAEYTGFTLYTESPAVTYDLKIVGPPKVTVNHGNGRHDVEVTLRGPRA